MRSRIKKEEDRSHKVPASKYNLKNRPFLEAKMGFLISPENKPPSTGLHYGLAGEESACNAEGTRDVGSTPGLGRSPGGGHGNLL